MEKHNLLILTDHRGHSAENSLYALVHELLKNPHCGRVDIASRGLPANDRFFNQQITQSVYTTSANYNFMYHPDGRFFTKNARRTHLREYDVIFLRLPHPVPLSFWDFLAAHFPVEQIINNPLGIKNTNTKEFLLNFPSVCPPMKMCYSVTDIEDFSAQFPIVLKPLRNYGGKGIVKVEGEFVWEGKEKKSKKKFLQSIDNEEVEYLGMKFLKNVREGDKRIVVINNEIVGASLRLPAKGSWICNVSMGGSSNVTKVTEREYEIMETINPILQKEGILYYGFDTLVNDNGQRTLSEINTTSIGGLPQIERMTGRKVVKEMANLVWGLVPV